MDDSLTTQYFSGNLKMYNNKRRQYQRLSFEHAVISSKKRKRVKIIRFGGGGGGGSRPWKKKIRAKLTIPKLRLFRILSSPMKILERLRDAYVEMMLCFAGNVAHLNNGNVFFSRRTHTPSDISG